VHWHQEVFMGAARRYTKEFKGDSKARISRGPGRKGDAAVAGSTGTIPREFRVSAVN